MYSILYLMQIRINIISFIDIHFMIIFLTFKTFNKPLIIIYILLFL